MKVAPAVAEVLGVVDDAAGSHTEGYGEVLSVAHAPVAAPARPAKEEATAPRPAEMERGPAAADEVQPGAGGAHGFVEFLGRWNEKEHDRAMPVKFKIWPIIWGRDTYIHGLRVAFSRFVDELVQNGASSGILAIRGHEFSWSASPDDKSYQRHGPVGTESTTHENIRFAFEGVVEDLGYKTRTRRYVNGHPTNAFNRLPMNRNDRCILDHWYRDSGCIDGNDSGLPACATKC